MSQKKKTNIGEDLNQTKTGFGTILWVGTSSFLRTVIGNMDVLMGFATIYVLSMLLLFYANNIQPEIVHIYQKVDIVEPITPTLDFVDVDFSAENPSKELFSNIGAFFGFVVSYIGYFFKVLIFYIPVSLLVLLDTYLIYTVAQVTKVLKTKDRIIGFLKCIWVVLWTASTKVKVKKYKITFDTPELETQFQTRWVATRWVIIITFFYNLFLMDLSYSAFKTGEVQTTVVSQYTDNKGVFNEDFIFNDKEYKTIDAKIEKIQKEKETILAKIEKRENKRTEFLNIIKNPKASENDKYRARLMSKSLNAELSKLQADKEVRFKMLDVKSQKLEDQLTDRLTVLKKQRDIQRKKHQNAVSSAKTWATTKVFGLEFLILMLIKFLYLLSTLIRASLVSDESKSVSGNISKYLSNLGNNFGGRLGKVLKTENSRSRGKPNRNTSSTNNTDELGENNYARNSRRNKGANDFMKELNL